MAFQMTYTDASGITHEQSYWRIVETNLCQSDRCGMITFYGYHDENARIANKAPIGRKSYSFAGDEYDTWFGPNDLSPEGRNPAERAYIYALYILEEHDNPASFFAGAKQI